MVMKRDSSPCPPLSVKSAWQQVLMQPRRDSVPPVALTPEVVGLLQAGAAVAVGVSGGKDSDACAIEVARHLDAIGHAGPRVLVHSDLGRVEWRQSLPHCEDLAALLGWELLVVRRRAGDMLSRWQGRWMNNLERYRHLNSVKLILPWSTPSMRFCTSELKTSVISSALKARFPSIPIVNATGIRREESAKRARMPVASPMAKLQRRDLEGWSWNPIIEFKMLDVLHSVATRGFSIHDAYSTHNTSRISCCYCIMSTPADLRAAAGCEDNHSVFVEMVDLEAVSTFAFQGNRWLADTAPHLLPAQLRSRVEQAKIYAQQRQELEARIPPHLLFAPGKPWPSVAPTLAEAEVLAHTRREILGMLGITPMYTDAASVQGRYHELMAAKAAALAASASEEEVEEDALVDAPRP